MRNKLRDVRESQGVTRMQLSDRLGYIYSSRLCNYETNLRFPTISEAYRIAAALSDEQRTIYITDIYSPEIAA